MIGIDEVGRGAWAGPLLVVAVRQKNSRKLPEGLTDSKLLSKKRREKLAEDIAVSCDIGQGWISADMVDELGLSQSLRNATLLALLQLDARNEEAIMIDGNVNFARDSSFTKVEYRPKADFDVPIVSAASIVAKVLRDQWMRELSDEFPGYGFASNVGYGTKAHAEALKKLGPTQIHRKTFRPIRKLV